VQFPVLIVSAFHAKIRSVIEMPNDLAIITAIRRQYWQNGAQKQGQLANVYFHCTANCVKLLQPAFIPFLVVIPSGLHPHLQASHRQHIAKELK